MVPGLIDSTWEVGDMKRGVRLSLLVLILVAGSVLLMGFLGLSCELWSRIALAGAKKVGIKDIVRTVYQYDTWDLPLERCKFLERFLEPGI